MVVTENIVLPSDEELTVQEINLTFPTLQAAAFHLGKYCEWQNNEFMLCKREESDTRKCLQEGKDVTACALDFFQKIKKNCRAEFDQYSNCIDKSSGRSAFEPCRKTQAVFDKCVLDKLNIERPAYGYFCEVKIHDTKRPKKEPVVPEYPKLPTFPTEEESPRLPPKYGNRRFWVQ